MHNQNNIEQIDAGTKGKYLVSRWLSHHSKHTGFPRDTFHSLGPAECAERSAAPPQVALRAEFQIKILAKYLQAQVAQLQKPRPRSPDFPLSISPPGSAHSAGPAPRRAAKLFLALFIDFWAFRNGLQNLLRKNIEKTAKIEDFGLPKPSQNPSKRV